MSKPFQKLPLPTCKFLVSNDADSARAYAQRCFLLSDLLLSEGQSLQAERWAHRGWEILAPTPGDQA